MSRLSQASIKLSKIILSNRARTKVKLQAANIRCHLLVRHRPLPSLLIIGAMRCGTSSLFKYLASHPETAASLRKEVRFFTQYWDYGLNWYRAHFPITRCRMAFEATPDYLFHPLAATRTAQTLPNVKLIVLLREPLARTQSHYNHMVRLGLERRPFVEALEEEASLMQNALSDLQELGCLRTFLRYSYLHRSYYANQLEPWFDNFPSENILILTSEDFYNNTELVLNKIAEFMGISPSKFSGVGRNYSYPDSNLAKNEGQKQGRTATFTPPWVLTLLYEENKRLAYLLHNRMPAMELPPWLNDRRVSG